MSRPTHYATRDRLTKRQEEILALVERGHTNGEIAQELGITLDGVKWHLREAFTKLDVTSREDAVAAWKALPRRSRVGGWLALGWLRWTVASAGVLAVAVVVGIAAVAMTGAGSDSDEPFEGRTIRVAMLDVGNEGEPNRLVVRDIPGGAETVLAESDSYPVPEDWSARGDYLAVLGTEAEGLQLQIFDSDGQQLANLPRDLWARAGWSPEHDRLAAITDAIVILTPDGEAVASAPLPPELREDGAPGGANIRFYWSPNGERVALLTTERVMVLGTDGSSFEASITHLAPEDEPTFYSPYWDSDSELLLYPRWGAEEPEGTKTGLTINVDAESVVEREVSREEVDERVQGVFMASQPLPAPSAAAEALLDPSTPALARQVFDEGNGLAFLTHTDPADSGQIVVAWGEDAEAIDVSARSLTFLIPGGFAVVLVPD